MKKSGVTVVLKNLVEEILRLLAREVLAREIDEHEVVVRAARDDAEAIGRELVREDFRILHDLLRVLFEARLQRFAERNSFRRKRMRRPSCRRRWHAC